FYSVLVYIPRDRYNTDVRRRVEAMLKRELRADHVDTNVLVGELPLAQLHLIVRPRAGELGEIDARTLEAELAAIVRNWQDDLRDELVQRHGEEKGLSLAERFGRALPAGYIEGATPAVAATDVERIAGLRSAEDLQISLYESNLQEPDGSGLRFKLYRQHKDIPLSDALPMMENMGLRVIAEHPHRIEVDGTPLYIQDFEVEALTAIDTQRLGADFNDAFAR